ncbi:nickel pincer cofactor biosynthesis protein LarC [Desulfomonile tiedjei]|uniref:Putative nickel insertion protein n=1 Tax=Desulfomonile tiedjei (strain ATCC 49306 / DSM 6799 / DCB-1) TaxID=706587 RepID=I4CC28_DESTA|nr:nickel pincer cofactor biosynthesis protein LarC [Desulfomonile tiedjei]AFM27119.1 TIGR00299 family protein [Desulfomonile tiedjei DSM 6799]
MRIAYFECFSGASGDMILGALLDAGLPLSVLVSELEKLNLGHFELRAEKTTRKGLSGTKAHVLIDQHHHGHHHRRLADITQIISRSGLSEAVKAKSLQVFEVLAEAEASVHGTTKDEVHFHEVGAMDSIIDIVGSVAGLAALGVESVFCSPLHVGCGTVQCAHGILPVPAPATAKLVLGKPVYSTGVPGELLTPTAAALLTVLASGFGPMPFMVPYEVGHGAGSRDLEIPNLLRVFIGDTENQSSELGSEIVAILETNIDDMNPQVYDHLVEKALGMGALDVFLLPIQMKKNRPATLVTIMCPIDLVKAFSDLLMRETTTIGVRWRVENRIKATRSIKEIRTKYGLIRFKIACAGDEITNIHPEYEDCKRLAMEQDIPLKKVLEEAHFAALNALRDDCS